MWMREYEEDVDVQMCRVSCRDQSIKIKEGGVEDDWIQLGGFGYL